MVTARNLLRSGLSIKEVSEDLGFMNQKNFHREFRDHYDIAPSQFRLKESKRDSDYSDNLN